MKRIHVIDSHTGGEPTRVVIAGGPRLSGNSVADQRRELRNLHDTFRSAVVNEPRGSDVLVGALLCQSPRPECTAGVIFFNNVGVLEMCGHGMIGVVKTLAYLGRLNVGVHCFDTSVGVVTAELHTSGLVSIKNVASYRRASQVCVTLPKYGQVCGDVAWGGNWFYLLGDAPCPLQLQSLDQLLDFAWQARVAVNAQGFPEVDHVEVFGPPEDANNHSRNFVLCPGRAYDRSPCGTGTSAKVACLAAANQLEPGEVWRQESIIGSVFEASYERIGDDLFPTITGQAWICGESVLLYDDTDPFQHGIRLQSPSPGSTSI